ncbi:MAG: hypothetical protein IT320_12695 [Anaerolineae bacterium]|nr:hypothetical protein [Anaerolineae bacterium]
MKGLQVALLLSFMLLAACQPSGPLRKVSQGDELAVYDFARAQTFEEGVLPGAVLRISNGIYEISIDRGDRELWWGQWGDTLGDVMIDVDVQQETETDGNAFGIMCRVRGTVGQPQTPDPELVSMMEGDQTATPEAEATEAEAEAEATVEDAETPAATATATEEATPAPEATETGAPTAIPNVTDGDGYLFLIQGSGAYGIFRSSGRSLQPLVDWATSDAINLPPAANKLRAVCVGDYLALYVNDKLVAEAIDDQYSSGQIGLVASSADRLGVRVGFDNLVVHEANVE